MKKILNAMITYFILAMAGGVFYREFTKMNGYEGRTTLGVIHTHLLVLGVLFLLIVVLLARQESGFIKDKMFKRFFILYNIALPFMTIMLVVRGILQVKEISMTKGMNGMISGFAGISHILMMVALLLFLLNVRKYYIKNEKE